MPGVAADQVGGVQVSRSGTVAAVSVPLVGKQNGKSATGPGLVNAEKAVLKFARANLPAGLVVHSAGAGGVLVAFIDAFGGLDSSLLLSAGLVVVIILLLVYRSPVLWFFPLFSAGLALGAAALVIYPLAKHDVITLNGQSQGILSVLVIGAGTDYALLLISRYREELHAYESRVRRDDRGVEGGGATHPCLCRHGDPRPHLPDVRRSQLDRRARAGVRHRHRVHGHGHAHRAADAARALRAVDLLAAQAAGRPPDRYRRTRRLGPVRPGCRPATAAAAGRSRASSCWLASPRSAA